MSEKAKSFLEKLKEKQANTAVPKSESAKMSATDCPNCGAGRAKHDGITHCAYCGFEFIGVEISDGIHLSKKDNSGNSEF